MTADLYCLRFPPNPRFRTETACVHNPLFRCLPLGLPLNWGQKSVFSLVRPTMCFVTYQNIGSDGPFFTC